MKAFYIFQFLWIDSHAIPNKIEDDLIDSLQGTSLFISDAEPKNSRKAAMNSPDNNQMFGGQNFGGGKSVKDKMPAVALVKKPRCA